LPYEKKHASDDSAPTDPVHAAAYPIHAATLIALLAALVVGFGGFTDTGASAAYSGAFVGMSLPSRLM
jgi:hypothetical protein